MSGFVKLYGAILDSSVWGEPLATRVVWITMLAMSDAKGFVAASSDGIARRANLALSAADKAIAALEAPDSRSRSDEFDGRRIERVDGGYRILNYLKYRQFQTDKQKADVVRQKRHRAKPRDKSVTSRKRHGASRSVATEAEAEAEAKTETTKSKATTPESGDSGAKAKSTSPDKPSSWVAEGVEWWTANVGTITHGHFGKALSPVVQAWTWPEVFPALKCYVEDTKARNKPAKPDWFSKEIIHWMEWSRMPAIDDNGLPTARARAIDRELRQ